MTVTEARYESKKSLESCETITSQLRRDRDSALQNSRTRFGVNRGLRVVGLVPDEVRPQTIYDTPFK